MHDVIIAGAGPIGLFLAGELALAGCAVLVLEQDLDPDSPLKHSHSGCAG
ncbi:FAD-dependent monooxygenase [Nocardia sp. NPDC004278]